MLEALAVAAVDGGRGVHVEPPCLGGELASPGGGRRLTDQAQDYLQVIGGNNVELFVDGEGYMSAPHDALMGALIEVLMTGSSASGVGWGSVLRRLPAAIIASFASIGTAVAALAPSSAFVWFRAEVIGGPDPATEPFAIGAMQRVLAAIGATLAGIALAWLVRRPALRVASPSAARLALAGVALAILIALNVRWIGVALGIWSWSIRGSHFVYYGATAVFTLATYAAVGLSAWRALDRGALAVSVALGTAYGCFSALWHCCGPIWLIEQPPWPIALIALVVAAVALPSFVAAVACRWRAPWGELAGALVFALDYPWHTPLWFAQCLLGGAFFVALARRAGTPLAGGIFLATAFVAHTTLPFAM